MDLFNEYEAMTPEAQMFAARAEATILPLVNEMLAAGARGREIEMILHSAISGLIAVKVLRAATEKRRLVRLENQRYLRSRSIEDPPDIPDPVISDRTGTTKLILCPLCQHSHVGPCQDDAPNAQFRCMCPGVCPHGRHPAWCNDPVCREKQERIEMREALDAQQDLT